MNKKKKRDKKSKQERMDLYYQTFKQGIGSDRQRFKYVMTQHDVSLRTLKTYCKQGKWKNPERNQHSPTREINRMREATRDSQLQTPPQKPIHPRDSHEGSNGYNRYKNTKQSTESGGDQAKEENIIDFTGQQADDQAHTHEDDLFIDRTLYWTVYEMVLNGMRDHELKIHCERVYQWSWEYTGRVIYSVRERMKKKSHIDLELMSSQYSERLEKLYQKTMNSQQYYSAFIILREIAETFDLKTFMRVQSKALDNKLESLTDAELDAIANGDTSIIQSLTT